MKKIGKNSTNTCFVSALHSPAFIKTSLASRVVKKDLYLAPAITMRAVLAPAAMKK